MLCYRVPLTHKGSDSWVCLRELIGEDEDLVEDLSTATVISLLDRLLIADSGAALGPGDAGKLSAPDRDDLLASVYSRTYGTHIESTTNCQRCGTPFDLDFSLEALQATLKKTSNHTSAVAEGDGVFYLPDGCRFRLPSGEDELAVAGFSAEQAWSALLVRCMMSDAIPHDTDIIQNAMQELAPIMDLELDAVCPECENKQSVHFDIQSYLLTAIQQERNQLIREVHRLASAYGWSLGEIMGLARSRRRALASLVEAELRVRGEANYG